MLTKLNSFFLDGLNADVVLPCTFDIYRGASGSLPPPSGLEEGSP